MLAERSPARMAGLLRVRGSERDFVVAPAEQLGGRLPARRRGARRCHPERLDALASLDRLDARFLLGEIAAERLLEPLALGEQLAHLVHRHLVGAEPLGDRLQSPIAVLEGDRLVAHALSSLSSIDWATAPTSPSWKRSRSGCFSSTAAAPATARPRASLASTQPRRLKSRAAITSTT